MIAGDNYIEVICAKIKVVHLKLRMQRIFNSLNICLKKVDDENIIHIKCDDDIGDEIDKDVEVDINENETDVLHIIDKDIILYSKRLFQVIKYLI